MFAGSASLFACASILGIDDGIPREDGGVGDATTLDVAPADSGPGPDAARDAIADGGFDAPVDVYSPMSCGGNTCNAVTQGCCRTGNGGDASPYAYVCVNDGGACNGPAAIVVNCDRGANCAAQGQPGSVCCANVLINAKATGVTCVPPSACSAEAGTVVCGPGDDELCASQGHACLASTVTIVGWKICK